MGCDFVALANKTKKEYICPSPDMSLSTINILVHDWFISSAVLYLITEKHRFQSIEGDYFKLLSGSWAHSEFIWISDYDDVYDGNDNWKNEWNNITSDVYVMLYECLHPEVYALIDCLKKDPRAILILGKVVEETKSVQLEKELEKTFGKSWRDWYYYAYSNRHGNSQLKWPQIRSS